jgi:hypothetical protein
MSHVLDPGQHRTLVCGRYAKSTRGARGSREDASGGATTASPAVVARFIATAYHVRSGGSGDSSRPPRPPQDVTLQELGIESFQPADAQTERRMRSTARLTRSRQA